MEKSKKIILSILVISLLISIIGVTITSIKLYKIHAGDLYIERSCNNFICKFINYTSNHNSNYNITVTVISDCNNSTVITKSMILSIPGNNTYCDKDHSCYYKCSNVLGSLTVINPKKAEPTSLLILLCIFMMIIGCLPILIVPWKLGFSCDKVEYEKI